MIRPVPDLLAIAGLALVALLSFPKIVLEGQIYTSYDLYTLFYPYQSAVRAALQEGRLPLWNPGIFFGVPLMANIQAGVLYPLNLALLLFPLDPPTAISASIIGHVFLAGLTMYLFARMGLVLPILAAAAAGLSFMLSGFFMGQIGHPNQLATAAWLPLVFLLTWRALDQPSARRVALAACVYAVQLLAGHSQEVYISSVALAGLVLFHAARDLPHRHPDWLKPSTWSRLVRPPLVLGAIALLGLSLAAAQILPTAELSARSTRAGGLSLEAARSFSLAPWLLPWSLLPGYAAYPDGEFTAHVGIVGLALALVGLLAYRSHPLARFALLLAVFALFMALGGFNPLFPLLHRFFPGVNLFRVPARWLLLYSFAAATLVGIGLTVLSGHLRPSHSAPARFVVGSLFFLPTLATAVAIVGSNVFLLPPINPWIWAIAPPAVGLAVLFGSSWRPGRPLAALAVTLLTIELWIAARPLADKEVAPQEAHHPWRPVAAHLQASEGLHRVLSLASADYDPGDLGELNQLHPESDAGSRRQLVSSAKFHDVVTPNLSMELGLQSVDGYDGGLLPLEDYITLKQVLLRSGGLATGLHGKADPLQSDALLRHQLGGVPNPGQMGSMNIRYVLADKIGDVWVDGAFYDLSLPRIVDRDHPLDVGLGPGMAATSLGLITHLSNDTPSQPDGPSRAVARVSIESEGGLAESFLVYAGSDTDVGLRSPGVASPGSRARAAVTWRWNPSAFHYYTRLDLPQPWLLRRLRVEYLPSSGSLVVAGASLLDRRTGTHQSLTLNQAFRISYSGDLKIYENLRWMPRAYLADRYDVVTDPLEAASAAYEQGPPSRVILKAEPPSQDELPNSGGARAATVLPPVPGEDRATVTLYQPERVDVEVSVREPRLLVLTDTYYPGWVALLDGREMPVLQANILFRAVAVPAGQHTISFLFRPTSLYIGGAISLLAALVVVLLLAVPFWRSRLPLHAR